MNFDNDLDCRVLRFGNETNFLGSKSGIFVETTLRVWSRLNPVQYINCLKRKTNKNTIMNIKKMHRNYKIIEHCQCTYSEPLPEMVTKL